MESSSEDDSASRKQKIEKLVEEIQQQRKKDKTRRQKTDITMSRKREPDEGSGGSKRGKRATYKLYIGHQHFSKGKCRVVMIKKGGGIRQMEYNTEDKLSVLDIINKATPLFFPEGISPIGDLADMEVTLASFSSENIETFKDVQGNDCSLQAYLKSRGMFSSQYHLYLRTKEKEKKDDDDDDTPTTLGCCLEPGIQEVNGTKPGDLKISFLKKKQSSYDLSDSKIICHSVKNCFNLSTYNADTSYEDYISPTADGFLLSHLEKDNVCFLNETPEGAIQIITSYHLTGSEHSNSIIYGPGTINGFNDGDLLIGCLSIHHNQGATIKWFRNNEVFFEQQNAAIIKVSGPGIYTVGVYINGNLQMSDEQCVVGDFKQTEKQNSGLHHSQIKLDQEYLITVSEQQLSALLQKPKTSPDLTLIRADNSVSEEQFSATMQESKTSPDLTLIRADNSVSEEQFSAPMQEPKIIPDLTLIRADNSVSEEQFSALMQEPKISPDLTLIRADNSVSEEQFSATMQESKTSPDLTLIRADNSVSEEQFSATMQESKTSPDLTLIRADNSVSEEQFSAPMQEPKISPDLTLIQADNSVSEEQFSAPMQEPKISSDLTLIREDNSVSEEQFSAPMQEPKISPNLTLIRADNSVSEKPLSPLSSPGGIGCTCLPKVIKKDITFFEEIGRGNFGVVHIAEWLGTAVAVKEMLVKRMKVAKPMIFEELKIHSKIRHPNIIQLMAYGIDADKLYMLSELNDGKNLDQIIFGEECEGKLSYQKKVEIAKCIIQAVAYLHNQAPKIIHRDIKPENVLVSADLKRIRCVT